MAYCKNCGSEISDNAYVCPNCGVKCQNSVPKKNCGMAIASLVMGILTLVGYYGSLIFGILAIVFSNMARKKILEDDTLTGEGMAKAGKIMGIVGICVWAVLILLLFVLAGCIAAQVPATY